MASAGRRDGHKRVSEADRGAGIATIAADYCYFNDHEKSDGTDDTSEHPAILIMKDRATGAIFSDVVQEKGAQSKTVDTAVDHLVWLGHPKIKLRSDGERAIKALLDKVSDELKTKGLHVVPDTTPVGDSQAGGMQESAVMEFKVKCRTLWFQACELHFGPGQGAGRHGVQRLLPWCIQYAGQLITRTRKDANGLTAWTKITGRREFVRPLIPWGEKVQYIAGGGKAKPGVSPKWSEGIFLGLVDRSNEYLIGTPEGIIKSSNAKRMTLDHAKDPELFTAIPWTPWRWTDRIGRPPGRDRHDDVPVELKSKIDIGMQVPT